MEIKHNHIAASDIHMNNASKQLSTVLSKEWVVGKGVHVYVQVNVLKYSEKTNRNHNLNLGMESFTLRVLQRKNTNYKHIILFKLNETPNKIKTENQ